MSTTFPVPGRRPVLWGTAVGVVVLGLLAWWLLPLGDEPPTGKVVFSTGTSRGVYEEYGEHLRSALAKDMPGLRVELRSSAGSQENVRRVADGEADFTIAAADAVQSYELKNPAKADQLRGVARLYDDYVQLVVADDSKITSVADLRHKRVATGLKDSGVQLIAERVLRAAGIDPHKDITPVSAGIDNGPDLLRDGTVDAFFWSGGLPTKGLSGLAKKWAFRFVPIDGKLVGKLHSEGEASRYYRTTNMPESAYPSVQRGATVATIAVSNLLVTRKDMDPRLTEWVTRTVIKSRDRIGERVHSAQLVDLRTAIYTDPLALHEGARRYYRSVKP
ncbi:TAXI family TRAP transporter solute-binding subunit [Streptomyces sp. DSM 110735]|uniref:TAXI family TRAP transporter solute-binding subunit n=1 Tax=Streptomyces sp. DSM 110735 TaxID=2775031 RepID=UPI0018F592C6|nr:TAXI family TRAP transporter solute-binding subunit [Streptomyces sp. DSM 110735]MBJ7903696.1 TAXI family TRAP transporter solute-binding subunit [Streptomyces sp. DSM 110735]